VPYLNAFPLPRTILRIEEVIPQNPLFSQQSYRYMGQKTLREDPYKGRP
jgi:hypothetical protein